MKWAPQLAVVLVVFCIIGFVLKGSHGDVTTPPPPKNDELRIQAEHNIATILKTEDQLLASRQSDDKGVTAEDCQGVMSELGSVSSSNCIPDTQSAFQHYKESWNELQSSIYALDNWVKDHKTGATLTEAILRTMNGSIVGMGADMIHEHSALVSRIRNAESAVRTAENSVLSTLKN